MAANTANPLDQVWSALSAFRKASLEVEAARGGVSALAKAAARGDEAQAAAMTGLIADAVQKLASRVAALQVSMDLVVKAATPEPVKVVKPVKAA